MVQRNGGKNRLYFTLLDHPRKQIKGKKQTGTDSDCDSRVPFCRPFLCHVFLLLLLFTTLNATSGSRSSFLKSYYSGNYDTAHEYLDDAFSDPIARRVWESRLHHQSELTGCDYDQSLNPGAEAMAMLRIGKLQDARKMFQKDWLSLLGMATISRWENNPQAAKNLLVHALERNPDRAELLFAAAEVAASSESAVEYFVRFLNQKSEDPYKRTAARQSVDFIQKTKKMSLNVASLSSPAETLDSEYDHGRLMLEGRVDQEESLKFLVDTGAAGMALPNKEWSPKVISSLVMLGLGKQSTTPGSLVVFDRFASGSFQMGNVVAAIRRSTHDSEADGILGSILFRNYQLLLPLRSDQQMMVFSMDHDESLKYIMANDKKYSRHVTFPFYQVNKMIILKGRIRDSERDMDILLDTGAQKSLISMATAKKHARIDYVRSKSARRRTPLSGLGGRINDLYVAVNVEVELGPLRKSFNKMPSLILADISEALELEVDLILGQDFLKGYSLLIDYDKNRVTFLY